MFIQKRAVLQPLIESRDGYHLTIYLANWGDSEDLKRQLNFAIDQCQDQLEPVIGSARFEEFIRPVEDLLHNASVLERMKSNIGIFRTFDSFRFIRIPLQVEYFCGVATSYHVKPLLRWLQLDRDFLLFNVEATGIQVYQGSQHKLRLLESLPVGNRRTNFQDEVREAVTFMVDRISAHTNGHKVQVFAAGRRALMQSVLKSFQKHHYLLTGNIRTLDHNRLGELYFDIRVILRQTAIRELEQAFVEYHCADELDRTSSTLEEIAQAAIQGRVRKLIVATGVHIFGQLDRKTGKVSIHERDLNHEDDDILDDLAQMVLEQGGEIIIASKNEMPKGKPALAILQHDGEGEVRTLRALLPFPTHSVAYTS